MAAPAEHTRTSEFYQTKPLTTVSKAAKGSAAC